MCLGRNHIEFDYENAKDKAARDFKKLVEDELELRWSKNKFVSYLKSNPKLEDMVEELADLLVYEEKVWNAKTTWDRQKVVKWMVAQQAIPCTMHMKVRTIETLLEELFKQCITERYQESRKESQIKKACMAAVTKYMNEHVFGNEEYQQRGQWTFPMENGELHMKGMTGNVAHKVLHHLSKIADIVYAEEFDESGKSKGDRKKIRRENKQKQLKWNRMMKEFVAFWKLVDQKYDDLTDEEIDHAHKHGQLFFAMCRDMFPERITNYFHLIGAGHITYYLDKHRNLYRFSQQGWEALNKLIKSQYHHKTNHGGCRGNRDSAMQRGQHLLPIANMLTRRTCWLLRLGQECFHGLEYCQPTGELPAEEAAAVDEEDEEEEMRMRDFLAAGNPAAII